MNRRSACFTNTSPWVQTPVPPKKKKKKKYCPTVCSLRGVRTYVHTCSHGQLLWQLQASYAGERATYMKRNNLDELRGLFPGGPGWVATLLIIPSLDFSHLEDPASSPGVLVMALVSCPWLYSQEWSFKPAATITNEIGKVNPWGLTNNQEQKTPKQAEFKG
jgi:hypothetical protein